MSHSPVSPTDLSEEEWQSLEQQNVVQRSTSVPGKCTVSGSFLSLSVQSDYASIPSSVATFSYRGFTAAPRDFELPTATKSAEALEFIGFTPEAAHEIFQRYLFRSDPSINPYDLIDFAYGQVGQLKNPKFEDLTPREALTRIGLTAEKQDALLDPEFSEILGTWSLYYWVEDTLKINYDSLLLLHQRLKNSAQRGGRQQGE